MKLLLVVLDVCFILTNLEAQAKIFGPDPFHQPGQCYVPTCRRSPPGAIDLSEPGRPPLFHDLTSREIDTVLRFMLAQRPLDLTEPSRAVLASNYVFSIELILPRKQDVFWPTFPENLFRRALVTVFNGAKTNPSVSEYCVIISPSPRFCGPPKTIPFSFRLIDGIEFAAAIGEMKEETNRVIRDILIESFGGSTVDCGNRCLGTENVAAFPGNIAGIRNRGYRGIWFPLLQLVEPSNLNPVDFVILMELDGSSRPRTADVWYNGQLFSSLQEFRVLWDRGQVEKLIVDFPVPEIRHEKYKVCLQRPPIEVEPDGKRYTIRDRAVTYFDWKFQFGISPTHGPQLFNIRYKDELIVYELSLQEVTVFYSSSEPYGRYANYFDTVVMIGRLLRTLVPGVDCPSHATFIDSTYMSETSNTPVTNKNAICIFEHNTGAPLRRHTAFNANPNSYFEGAPAIVLTVRTVATLVNYDYIFDFVFYQNGVVETRVKSSGIIVTSFKSTDMKYGFQVNDRALGLMHHHMFNFKVDVDIGGMRNSYSTYDIEVDQVPNRFSKTGIPPFWFQNKITRVNYRTEREAAYRYNFDTPKYHVFYNRDNLDKFGNPRAYRLKLDGVAKNIFPEGTGNEPGAAWMRYQLAVTQRKEAEARSSSKYVTYDGEDLTVNFEDFIGSDSIEQEDLVAWVTLGMQHIPHSEDQPVMPTPGKDVRFYLMPFNYFPEDPSVGIPENVRIEYSSPTGPLKIRTGTSPKRLNCLPPRTYNVFDLKRDPDSFISRPPATSPALEYNVFANPRLLNEYVMV